MSHFTQHSEELSTRSDSLKNQFLFFLQTSSRSAKAPKRVAKKHDPDLMGSESISSIFYRHQFTRKTSAIAGAERPAGLKKKKKKRERLASLHRLLLLFLLLDPHRASRRFSGHTARC